MKQEDFGHLDPPSHTCDNTWRPTPRAPAAPLQSISLGTGIQPLPSGTDSVAPRSFGMQERTSPTLPLGRKPFPMAFGHDVDGAVDHSDGSVVVNRVGRHWYLGGHSFHVGRGTFRVVLVIQVRKQRKVNQSQPRSDDEGRLRVVVCLA